jgi:hypothetical protein
MTPKKLACKENKAWCLIGKYPSRADVKSSCFALTAIPKPNNRSYLYAKK